MEKTEHTSIFGGGEFSRKVIKSPLKYCIILVLLVALIPFFVKELFYLHLGNLIFISLISAVGWNLIARTGQFSFGQAGFWAMGAYCSALLTTRLAFPFFAGLFLSVLLAGIMGVVLGMVFVRASGIFFTLLTFATAEVIRLFIVNFPSLTNGVDGISGIPAVAISIIGLDVQSKAGSYWFNLFFAVLVVSFCNVLVKSPWGKSLEAIRDNELLANCTGINVRWYKTLSFGIGCAITGLSGSLFAHYITYISPSTFNLGRSLEVVVINVVGGVNFLAGPIIGAFFMTPLPEYLRSFVALQAALYGLILVLMTRFLPGGIVPLLERIPIVKKLMTGSIQENHEDFDEVHDWRSFTDNWIRSSRSIRLGKTIQSKGLLTIEGITKNFGGLAAVSNVDLSVGRGEILGIIGPNGAGKTTLFNLISGVIKANRGRTFFKGENITGFAPHKISRRGLTRTFQATNCYTKASVLENMTRACNAAVGGNLWSSLFATRAGKRKYDEAGRRTLSLLGLLGLNSALGELPTELPYGKQRQLQLAIALASEPEIILLDEPISGMNPTEIAELAEIVNRVNDMEITVLLVEHNMDFVMSLCDRIIVLDHGMKIAEGTPEEIRNNPAVIEAYLGAEDVH